MASFVPENDFEAALMAAASDPAARYDFYKAIQRADLFVIQDGDRLPRVDQTTLPRGESVQIQFIEDNGYQYLPVFSSLTRLEAVLSEECSFLKMNALDLFELTKGADLILNPGCEFGKELPSDEVAAILDGTIFGPLDHRVTQEATEVMIGEPERYPRELANGLSAYFSKNHEVSRAWLVHFHDPSTEDPPHTLIAIEHSGDWDRIVSGAGLATRDVMIPDPPVDFMPIRGMGGLDDYFTSQCEPFYKKS